LQIRWNTSDGKPPAFVCPGARYTITAWVQNTGPTSWPADNSLFFDYVRPKDSQSTDIPMPDAAAKTPPVEIAPGEHYTPTVTWFVPTNVAPGSTHAVRFDMFKVESGGAIGFREVDAQHPWFPSNAESILAGSCGHRIYLPTIATGAQ
jgi:hypothetical protein